MSFKVSTDPCTLRGGVRGDGFVGRSVGRKTAGTYNGDLSGLSCRDCKGNWCKWALGRRGEVGELFTGVAGAELNGERLPYTEICSGAGAAVELDICDCVKLVDISSNQSRDMRVATDPGDDGRLW